MPPIPYTVSVRDHHGSSWEDILNEPQWGAGHNHHVGFSNNQGRIPGLTHMHDDPSESDEEIEGASYETQGIKSKPKNGGLMNFRELMKNQKVGVPELDCIGTRYNSTFSRTFI